MTFGIRGGGNVTPNGFSSLLAQRYQRLNSVKLAGSLQKLASGYRINRGADDPAGLIASENLRATLAALEAESRTLDRTDHQAATAEGAMGQISDMLVKAKGLAVANANDAGLSDLEKQANQAQIDSILTSVDRVSRSTSFAGNKLLDGTFSLSATNRTLAIDSTASGDLGATSIDATTYNLADLKSGGRLETTDSSNVTGAQQVLDAAISHVSTQRGRVGAFQKHTIQSRRNSLDAAYENLKAAESQIRDLDYAAEISRTVRYELLHRSSLGALKLINNSARRGRLDLRA